MIKTQRLGRCEHVRPILKRVMRKITLTYFYKNHYKENKKLWTKKLISKK